MSKTTKGYLFAFLTTISLANVYIFSKAALETVNLTQFGFYWFGFAILWNILYSSISGNLKTIKPLNKFQVKNLLGIGLLEVVATASIFIAIKIIPNPTIPSLIRNIEPVLIVILSIIVLKEKFNTIEKLGVAITILGTILVAYNKNSLDDFFVSGVEFIILSSIFYATRTIWSKKVIHYHTALSLNRNKITFLFVTALFAAIISKQNLIINSNALLNIAIGSLIGPFFTSYAQFISLKYIDASRATMIQSATGFVTMIIAYFYFNSLPHGYQIIGGLISIIGLLLVTYRSIKQRNKTN